LVGHRERKVAVIEFGILGPLVVRADIGDVRVVGARRRALLVRLIVSAGQPIPPERLADDLWEGTPPAGAKSTLSSHISLLRGLVGPDRIWSRDGGYVLKAAESEIDAQSFELEADRGRDVLSKGQFQSAAILLEHALGRWRGDALADVAGSEWALPDIARLEGLRLATFESWIDARLTLGEHAAVVPALEAALAEHPLRERLSGQLMLALYRSGRQADALGIYRRLQTLLGEELGIVPSAQLLALEEAIVLQDPDLTWHETRDAIRGFEGPGRKDEGGATRTGPTEAMPQPAFVATGGGDRLEATLPSDLRWLSPVTGPRFVGRSEELDRLCAEWRETVFRPRLVVVEGNAGVGKTRLVGETARRIDALGGMVLFGRCDEEAVRPCQPFGEILDYLAQALSDEDFFSLVAPYADELSFLSRPIARRLHIDQARLLPHTESDRYRLLEAVGGFLSGVGARRALFLVVDDLQWADPLTMVVVRHLLSRLEPTPVTLVATARDEQPEYRQRISRLVSRLDPSVSSNRLPVEGLLMGDTELLFRGHHSATEDKRVLSEVWRVTRGNPFFILQIAHQLDDIGLAALDSTEPISLEGVHVPQRVQELIDLRISRLTGDAVALMTVGSVFGERFALEDAAEVGDMDPARVLAAIDELHSLRFVFPQEGDTYRFDHELVRRAVYDSLAPARRLRLHRQVGRCLSLRGKERFKAPVGEVAYHFAQAAPLGPPETETAATWARLAGDGDFSQLAFESAARHYESALELLQRLPDGDRALTTELCLRLGESLNGAGETERGKGALRAAFDIGREAHRTDLRATASLLYGGSLPLATNVDDESPSQMLREVLNELDDSDAAMNARCRSRLALWCYRSGSRTERQNLCDEALALARETDEPRVLAAVLHDRSWALFGPDDCHGQLEAGSEMVAIGVTLQDEELILHGQQCRLHALLELGPAEETWATGDEVARLASKLRHPAHLWSSTVHKALLAANGGRFSEAAALSETALHLHRPSDQTQAFVAYGTQRFQRHWLQGLLNEDRKTLGGMVSRTPGRLSMTAALLWAEVETGHLHEARVLLDRIDEVGWSAVPKDLEWWPIMVSAAIATHRLEDARIAETLYQWVLPYRDHNCVSAGVGFFGNAEHTLGLLADASGELVCARGHFEAGLRRYLEWDAAPFAALCRRDLARVMSQGDGESRDEGRRLLTQSVLDATRLGMMGLQDQLRMAEGVADVAR
jgi:DNA-binding SARP family transcriptional activator